MGRFLTHSSLFFFLQWESHGCQVYNLIKLYTPSLFILFFFVAVLEVWIVAQLLVVSPQVPDMKVSEVNVSQCGKALLPSNYCTICSLNPWRTSCLKKGLKSCLSWIPPYLWFRGRCSKVLATLKSLAKGM